jgi:hypothetical protein
MHTAPKGLPPVAVHHTSHTLHPTALHTNPPPSELARCAQRPLSGGSTPHPALFLVSVRALPQPRLICPPHSHLLFWRWPTLPILLLKLQQKGHVMLKFFYTTILLHEGTWCSQACHAFAGHCCCTCSWVAAMWSTRQIWTGCVLVVQSS